MLLLRSVLFRCNINICHKMFCLHFYLLRLGQYIIFVVYITIVKTITIHHCGSDMVEINKNTFLLSFGLLTRARQLTRAE